MVQTNPNGQMSPGTHTYTNAHKHKHQSAVMMTMSRSMQTGWTKIRACLQMSLNTPARALIETGN